MSRLLNDASSQYLKKTGYTPLALPFSFACWFKCDDATGIVNQSLMIQETLSGGNGYQLELFSSVPDEYHVRARALISNVSTGESTTTDHIASGAWGHAAGVFTSTTSRTSYLNGDAAITNTTNTAAVAAMDSLTLGARRNAVPAYFQFFSGNLAHASIWSVSLTAAEVALLALGLDPRCIRPDKLVHYWPLDGNDPERDTRLAANLYVMGGATHSLEQPHSLWRPPVLRVRVESYAALRVRAVASEHVGR